MAFDMYGPHQGVMFAKHSLLERRGMPEMAWEPTRHIGPVKRCSKEETVFGRNELSPHHFHQWVDRLVQ